MPIEQVCVYCASSSLCADVYLDAAFAVGQELAGAGKTVRYGGGDGGLMGKVADGALAAGGRVVGVLPRFMQEREWAHLGLTELHLVETMHERKAIMAERADAFVALPGGIGTLEEFFEVWTWGQLGLHRKPYGLLNVAGFYDPLLAFLDHAVGERFVRAEHRALLVVESDVGRLLERLDGLAVPVLPKWLDRTTT